ncbi:LysE family translocator [Peribacillus muralis]|uniref:LysE family translocator n=1 Tax=Peribacillus muralis TaxID=264697 RepID=UPI003CFD1FF6
MLVLLFSSILLGLSIALPIGTISIEMIKQGLKNGFMHGWSVGLGGMTIDLILIILLFVGLAPILTIPFIQVPLWIIGAIVLFHIGYDSIKNADHEITLVGEKSTKSLKSSYKNGLLVAISPGNLVFWVSIFGTILSNSFDSSNIFNFFIVSVGIIIGILIHDIGLMAIVTGARKFLKPTYIKRASIVAGLVLIGFGCYFLYKFIDSIPMIM